MLLTACGLKPNAYLILAVAFIYMSFIPLVRVCRESIWQRKVPAHLHGRVFAIQKSISQCAIPLAAVIAGILADSVFEPLMAVDGSLAPVLGPYIGVGPGRGVALIYIILGVVYTSASVAGLLYRPLRDVDTDLPDMI